jgi:hypothetical protein
MEVGLTNTHVAGAGFGALVGSVIVALGGRIGLDLTNFDSVTLGVAAVAAGAGVFHVLGRAGSTVGVFPAVWRFLFGPGKTAAPVPVKPVAAPVVAPAPASAAPSVPPAA